jgi:hypothetical protein
MLLISLPTVCASGRRWKASPSPCHLTFPLLTLDERSHVMLRAGVFFLQANLRLNDKMQQFNSMNKAAQVRKGGR